MQITEPMMTITKEVIKKEIEIIIEEHGHTQEWIKDCVGDKKDETLNRFINKLCRSIKFDFEYDPEEEVFNLLDSGKCDVMNTLVYCDLVEFIDGIFNHPDCQELENEAKATKSSKQDLGQAEEDFCDKCKVKRW